MIIFSIPNGSSPIGPQYPDIAVVFILEDHLTGASFNPPNVKTPPTVNASNDAEIPNIKPWCFVTRGCLKYERGKGLPSGYVKIAIENASLFRGFPL